MKGQYSTEFPQGFLLFCFSRPDLWVWCFWTDQPSCKQLRTCTCHCERRNIYALGKDFVARWGNPSKFPVALLPCLSCTSQLVAILANLGVPLRPGDTSLWHCLGSRPWTCVLLPWAHTQNEAEHSWSKQVLFFTASARQLRKQQRGFVCRNVWPCGGERPGKGSAAPRAAVHGLAQPHLHYFQAASLSLRSPRSHQAGCQQRQRFGRFLNADWASVWQAICTIWHPRANPGEGAGQRGGPKLKCHLEVKHQPKWHKAIMPNNERDRGGKEAGEQRMTVLLKPAKFLYLLLSICPECLEMLLCWV